MREDGPPAGFRGPLEQRQITRETIPDLVVAMAEGRLKFQSAEVMRRSNQPTLTLRAEDLIRSDPEILAQIEQYPAVMGNFWQRDEEQ